MPQVRDPRPEPVMNNTYIASTLVTFVKVLVLFLTAIGVLDWSETVQTLLQAVVIAGVDVAILFWVMYQRVRPNVTPVQDPQIQDTETGAMVPLVRADGKELEPNGK